MISRRDLMAFGLGTAVTSRATASAASAERNVLFLAIDDLRPELGCYGNRLVSSPNLDRLAERSMVFERAYCQAPVCGPSRASLLTGLRPDTTRVWGNKTHFRETLPDIVTLPQRFKQEGYHSESIGKVLHGRKADPPSWSVPEWPAGGRQAGMQYVDEERFEAMRASEPKRVWSGTDIPTLTWTKRHSWQAPDVPDNALQDGQVADRAVEALRRLKDRRFFLGVGFQKPHLPFTAPRRYYDLYDPASLPVPRDPQRPADSPELAYTGSRELRGYTDIPESGPVSADKARELVHGYYAATSYMDAQVGRVLDELRNLGLTHNTVVILFGDHGFHLGEQRLWGKTTTFELDARAPLMLHVPEVTGAGQRCNEFVELVDMYPTLCEACGIEPPSGMEGRSMLPLLSDPTRPWKRAAFSQITRPYLADKDWKHMGHSIRTDRHRYTEWTDRDGAVTARELYDFQTAPIETVNLAGRGSHKSTANELSRRLRAGWQAALPETGD